MNEPSALRLYAEDHPALAFTLAAKLEKLRDEKIDQLIFSTDWADFKFRHGEIYALNLAIAECKQANEGLNW